MLYKGYLKSHGGKIRTNNEDNGYLDGYYRIDDQQFLWSVEKEKENNILAAVFDGMGGEEQGEVASRLAARTMYGMKNKRFSVEAENYAKKAGDCILGGDKKSRKGTTYVAVSVEDNQFFFSNIGDSRGYLFRNGQLTQMTKDHNMVQEMLKEGILTPEQAKKHPDRHSIYQFLGMQEEDDIPPEPHCAEKIEAQQGDICLLCSDGLTDMLEDEEISRILSSSDSVKEIGDCLVEAALDKGGKDNVTVLLLMAQ